jgi:hypothetical protein
LELKILLLGVSTTESEYIMLNLKLIMSYENLKTLLSGDKKVDPNEKWIA